MESQLTASKLVFFRNKPEMVDNNTKRKILEKILESNEFYNSKTYKSLLTFLVEASIRGESIKEFTIATEVLGKNTQFDPSNDTSVRVYIHNLRKKLQKYYQTEGAHDKIILEIPKGHYEVRYIDRAHWNKQKSAKHKNILFIVLIGLIISLFSNSYILQKYIVLKNRGDPAINYIYQNGIWGDIIQSTKPTLIALGDHFFYLEYQDDIRSKVIVRNKKINSLEDFYNFEHLYPNKKISAKVDHPYFAMNSVWPLKNILPVFIQSNKKYWMNYNSAITSHDLLQNNIIFIGSYKTLGVFEQVAKKLKFCFSDMFKDIVPSDSTNIPFLIYESEGNAREFHRDYCIFAKVPGPSDNIIMLFISSHATGTCGGTEFLTHPVTMQRAEDILKKKYGEVPKFFEILFEVHGFNRINLKSEIKDFFQIDSTAKFW